MVTKSEAWEQTIDVFGRGSILLLAAVGINKSNWYQETPGYMPLNDPFTWIVSLAMIGCIAWMFYPAFAFGRLDA